MLARNEKDKIIENIKGKAEKAEAVFLTNLIGIPSNDAVAIRKDVREADGAIVVAKNTLIQKALQGSSCEAIADSSSKLKGTNALAFAFSDAAKVAKILYDAQKEFEVIEFKKGVLSSKELTKEEIVALAKLPSRDQMLATVLATFSAPISAFVRVLNAIKEKKEEEAQA